MERRPERVAHRVQAELAALSARLDSLYGKGKWCGADGKALIDAYQR